MSLKTDLIQKQQKWALEAGLELDERGYLASYEQNLYTPLNKRSKQAFEKGSGSELRDTHRYPAKMRALHSSSALAVNFFNFWVEKNATPIVCAMDLEPEPVDVRFEEQYPTGLPGNPPNLDVVLEYPDASVVGIESKFTEWFTPKSATRAPFKDKYFPAGTGVWEKVGLNETQRLAESIHSKELSFSHLDAPQLVKHALGLATHLGRNFRLLYIYYDGSGDVSSIHRSELDIFSEHVQGELGFQSLSYQELFSRLGRSKEVPIEYLEYLRSRYM